MVKNKVEGPFAARHRGRDPRHNRSAATPSTEPALRISSALRHLPLAVVLADLEFNVVEWNEAAVALTGWLPDEITGHSVIEFMRVEFPGHVLQDVMVQIRNTGTWDGEAVCARPDGTRVPLQVIVRPVENDDGVLVGFISVGYDPTREQGDEAAMRAEMRRFGLLTANMQQGFAYCRMIVEGGRPADFVYLHVNPAFEALTGLTDVVGRRASAVIPGIRETSPDLLAFYGRIASTGTPELLEAWVEPLGKWFRISAYSPARDHFVAVFDDVTHRIQADRELRQLSRAVEQSPASIMITDTSGNITYVNAKFCEVSGYGAAEVLGRNPRLLKSGHTSDDQYRTLWHSISAGREWRGELQNRRKDGGLYWEFASISPVRDPQGKIERYLAVKEDITARKRNEALLARQISRLAALRSIDMVISNTFDVRTALDSITRVIVEQLDIHACCVLLLVPQSLTLKVAASVGLPPSVLEEQQVRVGEGLAGRVARERALQGIPDLEEDTSDVAAESMAARAGFSSVFAAPLVAKGRLLGVLEVFRRQAFQPDNDWLAFLETLAGQMAIAIENAQLYEGLERSNTDLTIAYDETIEGWARALDLRDSETEGHSRRVTDLTLELARAIGVSESDIVHVRRGALLHDIGKMGISDAVLLKPGALTAEERALVERHPVLAYEMLRPITYLRPALDIPYCHHEHWDGTGYPRGLKGDAIPLAARVFAVVDVWDALRSERPYRAAWTAERARDYVASLAGTQFDPQVVAAFLRLESVRAVT